MKPISRFKSVTDSDIQDTDTNSQNTCWKFIIVMALQLEFPLDHSKILGGLLCWGIAY